MIEMKCKTCHWFRRGKPEPGQIKTPMVCYFNPPQNMAIPQPGGIGVIPMRPIVYDDEGCNKHSNYKENALTVT